MDTTIFPDKYNEHNENILCSYYMHVPDQVTEVNPDQLLHPYSIAIIKGLQYMSEKQIKKFSFELLSSIIFNQFNITLHIETLKTIYTNYTTFGDIDHNIEILKSDYIKSKVSSFILEDIITKTKSANMVDPDEMIRIADKIYDTVYATCDTGQLKTTEDLVREYKNELDKRATGEHKRSLGFRELDIKLLRPAGEGEISIIVGNKGSGKSIFLKNIENILINKRIPVLSFNPEMPDQSTMDRLMGLREGINTRGLQDPYETEELQQRIDNALNRFKDNKYYLYNSDPIVSLNSLESTINKAKQLFRSKGLLAADEEYIVVTADLFSMFTDFGDQTPSEIEKAMNRAHQIVRKTKVHLIGVIQANENKLRNHSKIFKTPDDVDFYKVTLEDIKNGSAYAERARVVLSLHRPLFLKRRLFPELEDELELEDDILHVNCIKVNDGDIFSTKMLYGENAQIHSLKLNS